MFYGSKKREILEIDEKIVFSESDDTTYWL